MPVEHFGSHFSLKGQINLISWPVCHIFIALSVDTRIGYGNSHNAIWLYSHMVDLWPYGCTAISPYGILIPPTLTRV